MVDQYEWFLVEISIVQCLNFQPLAFGKKINQLDGITIFETQKVFPTHKTLAWPYILLQNM